MMRLSIILVSLCFLSSCGADNETFEILHAAESFMTEQPEKAKLILETVPLQNLDRPAVKAKYALLYAQALDKNYIDTTNDSLISIAVDYYDRKGSNSDRALARYYHGRICANANDVDHAMESYVYAEQAASETGNNYLLGLINSGIAYLYCSQSSLDEAMERYRRAADFFHMAKATFNEALVLSSIARTHYLKNEYADAYIRCNEAVELFESIHADTEIIKLQESIAVIQLEQYENTDSIKKRLSACYAKLNSGEIPIASMGLWQTIYLREHNLDSARICGTEILNHRELFSAGRIAGCLAEMGRIEYLANNPGKAYRYSLQYESLTDSLHVAVRNHLVQETEQKFKNQILKNLNENLQIRTKYMDIIIVLLIVILILSSLLAARLFMYWRRRVNSKIQHAHAEIRRLSSTYNELQTQYDLMKQKIDAGDAEEMRLLETLEERLRGMRDLVEKTKTLKSAAFLKKFQEYAGKNTKSKIAFIDLQYVVNKRYHNVIKYLAANYPQLTKHDLDLCSLLCFGFSQYSICYLYGYGDIQSFYNKRHRLRDRLGLRQDQKIEDFIQETIRELVRKAS